MGYQALGASWDNGFGYQHCTAVAAAGACKISAVPWVHSSNQEISQATDPKYWPSFASWVQGGPATSWRWSRRSNLATWPLGPGAGEPARRRRPPLGPPPPRRGGEDYGTNCQSQGGLLTGLFVLDAPWDFWIVKTELPLASTVRATPAVTLVFGRGFQMDEGKICSYDTL
jgi:hypothetical protein